LNQVSPYWLLMFQSQHVFWSLLFQVYHSLISFLKMSTLKMEIVLGNHLYLPLVLFKKRGKKINNQPLLIYA
jgi:hypothetical protein